MLKYIPYLVLMIFLTSCTYSINIIHTQGEASDVVDETSIPTTTVSPSLTTPIKI